MNNGDARYQMAVVEAATACILN